MYPSPLCPHDPLPGRVRGEEERHGGTIARSEIRRAVRTGCNSNLRRSVDEDTDDTALTLMCVKLLDGTGEESGPVELVGIAPVRDLAVTDSVKVSVVVVTKEVY